MALLENPNKAIIYYLTLKNCTRPYKPYPPAAACKMVMIKPTFFKLMF